MTSTTPSYVTDALTNVATQFGDYLASAAPKYFLAIAIAAGVMFIGRMIGKIGGGKK